MSTTGPATGRKGARSGEVRARRSRSFTDEPRSTAGEGASANPHEGPATKAPDPVEAAEAEATPRPARDKFEIFVHPRADTFAGRIWHPFSRRERPLQGLDGARIVQFIRECMPVSSEPSSASLEPLARPITRDGVVKELELRQGERRDCSGLVTLRPEQPWSVTVRMALAVPPPDPVPFNVADYTLRLVARRPEAAGSAEERMEVGRLTPGQSEYESRIEMPPLPAGEYVLDAYTRVPWAAIAECDRTRLHVG